MRDLFLRALVIGILAITPATAPALADANPAAWAANLATLAPTDSTLTPIAQFPGTFLVPSDTDPFFSSLSLASGSLIPDPGVGSGYQIQLAPSGAQGIPLVELNGSLGQPAYLVQTAVPVDCSAGMSYCAYDQYHDAGLYFPDDQPGSERFWGLSVGSDPAVADHHQCCDGEGWSIAWYDPQLKQSFALTILYDASSVPVVQQLFGVPSGDLSPDDLSYANQLASVAAGLVQYQISLSTPASSPSAPPSPAPVPTAAPPAAPAVQPASTCGAPQNPYGFNFCGGSLIVNPPRDLCNYFACIASFWNQTSGYVIQCQDGDLSHSGGVRGSCSSHGGNRQPLYQPRM